MNRILLFTLAISVVLAGCATNTGPDGENGGSTTELSESQARDLFAGATNDFPDKFGFEFKIVAANGTTLFTVDGAVDNATGRSFMQMKGDPYALGESFGEGQESAADLFRDGFGMYQSPDGSAIIIDDTAFVFPPDGGSGSGIPDASDNPFEEMINPKSLMEGFQENVNVTSVRPITYRGQGAVEITFNAMDDSGDSMTGKAIMFRSPARIAYIEVKMNAMTGDMGEDSDDETPDILRDATFKGDFFYEDAKVKIPAVALRAMGLAYTTDADPFSYGGGDDGEPKVTTWTFSQSGGIALSEVEIQVKAEDDDDPSDGYGVGKGATLWTMKLSEGTGTYNSTTVKFTDNDGDGKVSRNDTLVLTTENGMETPSFLLYDTVTKTYVVPGPGIAFAVGALALLALAIRRK